MKKNLKIAYWLRTDIQHFAHVHHIYETLGGVILTKNKKIYDHILKKHPQIGKDLYLVKNSTKAKILMNKLDTKLVVYTGFQLIFWGYSVQVFHGASDKRYLLSHKRILLYDLLLLPGQKHMDKIKTKYKLDNYKKFKKVGYPKFDKLMRNNISRKPIFNNNNPTILYAPTWITEGSGTKLQFSDYGESSLPLWGEKIIKAVAHRYNLIIKYHSRIYDTHIDIYEGINKLIKDLKAEDTIKTFWDSNITEYMAQSDIMISDISAVCYEWFHTNRPIIFANPAPKHYKPSTDELSNTFAWQAGDVLYTEDDIIRTIEANLKKDSYKEIRNKLLNHSFHQPDGHATERQSKEIELLYNKVKDYSKFKMVAHNLKVFIKDAIRHRKKKIAQRQERSKQKY